MHPNAFPTTVGTSPAPPTTRKGHLKETATRGAATVILDEIGTDLSAASEILDMLAPKIALGPTTPINDVHDPVIGTSLPVKTSGRNRPDEIEIPPRVK